MSVPVPTNQSSTPPADMASRVAAFDWSQTILGPRPDWPEMLRIAVDLCLANRFPMHVWWGPQLLNIYNDAHVPLHAHRHPGGLGRPAPEVWADVWPVLAPQVEAVFQRGESTWNHRTPVQLERNGCLEEAWFTWAYSPIRDPAGQIAGLICIATEDTQQVLAERKRDRQREEEKARSDQELRNSTILLRGISDSIGDVIFSKDLRGRLQFANPGTLALIGKPLEEVIGKTDAEFLGDVDAARAVMENDRRIIENGIAEDLEEVVPNADGSRRVWFSRKVPYRDGDGNVIGLLGISRDITERKAAEDELHRAREAAEAANRAKDQLLAVVSHELRTPLNPILAITSYLQTRTDLSADLREDVDTIRRNVEQEARIVDDLLSLTRLHRGKVSLHQEAVDLHTMIHRVIGQFATQIDAKRLQVLTSLDAKNWYVWADPARLQQVFSNLLGNAVKFTAENGRITLRSITIPTGEIRIEITDTGIGIEPEVLPKLFSPFEQGEKTITRRFGGLGLGLVIAKGIIDLHKGTIAVASQGSDKGTAVTVELHVMQPAMTVEPPPAVSSTNQSAAGKRILLVEDHDDTLKIMRRVLASLGYQVLTATNVKEAIDKIGAEPFDLLVSDIGLPDGSGLEIMRTLRDRKGIRGIAMSGFSHDEDVRRSKEAGFAEHLIKPVDFRLLDSTLKRAAV